MNGRTPDPGVRERKVDEVDVEIAELREKVVAAEKACAAVKKR